MFDETLKARSKFSESFFPHPAYTATDDRVQTICRHLVKTSSGISEVASTSRNPWVRTPIVEFVRSIEARVGYAFLSVALGTFKQLTQFGNYRLRVAVPLEVLLITLQCETLP
jgi:hypothetical protein